MADPIVPPDPAAIDASNASLSALADTTTRYGDAALRANENTTKVRGSLESTTEIAKRANLAFNSLDNISKGVSQQFSGFKNSLERAGTSIASINSLTEQQAKVLGLVSASVLGVQKQFRSIGDTSSLATFSTALSTLKDTAQNRHALLGTLTSIAEKVGTKLPSGIGSSMEMMKNFAMNLLTSSDNALHAQNAFLQMSATAGNLSDVFNAAGPNLQNINQIMEQQIDILNQSANATGLTGEVVEKYWSQLGRIPGTMGEVIRGTTNMGGSMNMLTASIALARGTGRSYEAIIQDLSSAYKNFGATGNDAFKMVAGLGEVANRTGVSFESIHEALMTSAGGFREFANGGKSAGEMMQGLSSIMVNYVDGLRKTGLSADVSVGIIKNMTDQIGKLTTAQKSFLSAQTGGPGGLMGANQIDMMIRNGQIERVFEKIRSQMQRQFGTIVTQQEASQSEFAARQFERQKLLLQRGPLGSLVQNDQQAARLLESFRARQEGRAAPPVELRDKTATVIERGLQLQRDGNNILTRIATGVEANQRSTDLINQGLVREALNPPEIENMLNEQFGDALSRGSRSAVQVGTTMRTGTFNQAQIGENITENIRGAARTVMQTPQIARGVANVGRGVIEGIQKTPESSINLENDPRIQQARIRQATSRAVASAIRPTLPPMLNDFQLEHPGEPIPAGRRMEQAIFNAARAQTIPRREIPAGAPIPPREPGMMGSINVHVKGYCLRCNNEIVGGDQMASISPAAKQTP